MFDDVEDSAVPHTTPEQTAAIAKADGVEIIPARAILDAAPDHDSFPCMDGIHKTEPYHRLMAALWLKARLATNQRGPNVALEHPQRQPAVASTAVAGSSAADSLSR
jgi:hypothetical protein